jgi:hypothetical protein
VLPAPELTHQVGVWPVVYHVVRQTEVEVQMTVRSAALQTRRVHRHPVRQHPAAGPWPQIPRNAVVVPDEVGHRAALSSHTILDEAPMGLAVQTWTHDPIRGTNHCTRGCQFNQGTNAVHMHRQHKRP